MKKTIKTLEEINKKLSRNEYLVIDKQYSLAIVYDRNTLLAHNEEKIKRLYKITKEGYEQINIDRAINELVDSLKDKVDLKQILESVLKTSNPKDIIEALERVKTKKKIDVGDGCVSLLIRGNKGQRPIEFVIRSG